MYYDDGGHRRYHTLGAGSMTKTAAQGLCDDFMRTVNGSDEPEEGRIRPVLLREFVDQVYLPFQRGRWKKSTQGTSENRINHHIVKGLGDTALKDFSLTSLQGYLERKAGTGLSFSVVDHLRWDLSAIFEMAVAEKVISSNPATRLYTPKYAPRGRTRAMTAEEVNLALGAVKFREQVLLHMAIFAGFRPGEMLALQRRHVSEDATVVKVEQRVYRGDIDDPKTDPSRREVAIPPRTAELLLEWMNTAVGPSAGRLCVRRRERQAHLEGHPDVRPHSSKAEAPRNGMGGLPGHAGDPRQHRPPAKARSEGDRRSARPRCGRGDRGVHAKQP